MSQVIHRNWNYIVFWVVVFGNKLVLCHMKKWVGGGWTNVSNSKSETVGSKACLHLEDKSWP